MVNRRGERGSRKRKKESAKACERRETKKGSAKRHFGITSGKRGQGTPARYTTSFSLEGTMNRRDLS
jgi:hypothetical protein